MKRIVIVQKVIQKCDGPLTPVVTKLFNKIKEAASECTVDWNGLDPFQVKGIPCKHAIAAIHDMADNGMDVGTPEDWVHESYKLQTWMNVYSHKINPVNSRDMWSKFECPATLLPPKLRKGKTVTCSLCQGTCHNKRGCKATGSSDGGQMNDMPSEHVGSQHVASQPLGSEPVATQLMARKSFARKFVARKPVQNKCCKKRAASKISNPANQAATFTSQDATQGSQAATQASRAPTIKRTKMSACRLTPDK
ncbi:hypothetical protein Tco_1519111 [Tanacetum coccineum]